jgi:hypothetical protein
MFAALLLAAIMVAPLGTVSLFVRAVQRRVRGNRRWGTAAITFSSFPLGVSSD